MSKAHHSDPRWRGLGGQRASCRGCDLGEVLRDASHQAARHLRSCQARARPPRYPRRCTCTVLRSPPMMPVSGETSLATIQSAPLALRFLGEFDDVLRFGGKANHQLRGVAPRRSAAMVLRMSGFSTSSSRGGPLAGSLLDFSHQLAWPLASRRRQRQRRQRRQAARSVTALQHLAAPDLDMDHLDAGGIGELRRACNQRHASAQRPRPARRSPHPACRRSGWRCSAPDRSARASGRW